MPIARSKGTRVAEFLDSVELATNELFQLLADPSDDPLERRAVLGDILSMVFGLLVMSLARKRGLVLKNLDAAYYLRQLQDQVTSSRPSAGRTLGHESQMIGFAPKWLMRAEPDRLFRCGIDQVLHRLDEVVSSVADGHNEFIDYVAMAFEGLYGRIPSLDPRGNGSLGSSTGRRDNGVFFTPPDVVEFLTKRTLGPVLHRSGDISTLLSLRILDPAVGAGSFLIESLRMASARLLGLRDRAHELSTSQARRLVATSCLYGVDVNPLATEVTKTLLWIEIGDPTLPISALNSRIRCADSLLGGTVYSPEGEDRDSNLFCWQNEFPDVFLDSAGQPRKDAGFDVILSNPPWGGIKPTLKEFYAHLDARVSNYQGVALQRFLEVEGPIIQMPSLQQCWTEYVRDLEGYAKQLRDSHLYQAQRVRVGERPTGGDVDLYKYFMERCFQLMSPRGRTGLVVPAGFERSEGATGLRHLFLENGTFEDFLEFQNKKRLFPIHGMFRFILMVYQKGNPKGIRRAYFGLTNIEEAQRLLSKESNKGVKLTPHYLRRMSGPFMSIPEVRSNAERKLLEKLHMVHPRLGEIQTHGWNVRFVRELDMTNDNHAFRDAASVAGLGYRVNGSDGLTSPNDEPYLPLYEGRMVHQFDHAAKAYRGGQGRTAEWQPLLFTEKVIAPHYFVAESYVARRNSHTRPRAGFCDITGHANERTVLAALIPKQAVCGNKVPTCEFDTDDSRIDLIWLSIANSFVIDWIARRKISTTLNFFQWFQIPFPRVDPDSPAGRELHALAAKLTHLDRQSEFSSWQARCEQELLIWRERAKARAQIDALVARIFELTVEDFALVLTDFPLLDRWQPALPLEDSEGNLVGRRAEEQSTVTRDVALLQFCRRSGNSPPPDVREILGIHQDGCVDLERRVALASKVGAIAYAPSELAVKQSRRCQEGLRVDPPDDHR